MHQKVNHFEVYFLLGKKTKQNKVGLGPRAPRNRRPGEVSSCQGEEGAEAEGEHAGGRSVDVSAHGEVDEDEDVELDEDGEAEEDGVEDEAGQAEPPIQGPLVEVDAENLWGRRR